MNKVTEYNSGVKRIIRIHLKNDVIDIQLSKSTMLDNEMTTGKSLYLEANENGTYRLTHGKKLFDDFDSIEKIEIIKQDFK